MTTTHNHKEIQMDTQRETTTPRSALARCLILACAIVAMYAVAAPTANAATYTVNECHGTYNPTGWADAQLGSVDPHFGQGVQCPGFGVAIAGTGYPPGSPMLAPYLSQTSWNFRTPAATYIRTVTFQYNLYCIYNNMAYVQANDANGGMQARRLANDGNGSCGSNLAPPGCQNYWCGATWTGLSTTNFYSDVYCYDPGGCYASPEAHANIKDLTFTLEDLGKPDAPVLGGSLVQGGPRRGTESLTASATDGGSGVSQLDVYVNGGRVDGTTPGAGCDVNGFGAQRFSPCPSPAGGTFSEATDAGPWHEGNNSLRICATDYSPTPGAGNVSCTDTTVNVDNSCDDSVGTTVGSNLDAGLAIANEQPKVNTVVSSKDSIQIKGSVTTSSGAPVAGANVCIYEQIATRGEDRALADIVHTKNNGTYTSRVDAGPSRSVYVDYRHSNLLLEKTLQLDSTALPTLNIRKRHIRNGHSMRFKGGIPGPYSSGRVVAIQAQVGRTWRTFKNVTTDTVGEFKGAYKFKHSTLARAKYKFRARVAEQDGYPFKTGISNKAKVIVKG
jgi:hypothetical protein